MHVKRTNDSSTKVTLTINADEKFMASVKDHVLRHLATETPKIPGFREGKAPTSIVEKHADPSAVQSRFLDEAVNRLYSKAVESENLKVATQPEISLKKFVPFTELEFEAKVEVVGPVKLSNYKAIKKTKKLIEITDKDIQEVIDALRKRMAERREVKQAAKDGNEAVIDFKGIDEKGNPVSGAEGKDYPLVLGSNTFIPGFEPNLIGLGAGDEKTFDVTFPAQYGVAALQNKKVTFTVKVNKVQELVELKADDEFAKKAGPFKTLGDLKADIKTQLEIERSREADQKYRNELLDEITAKSQVELPASLIDEQVLRAEEEEKRNLAYRGQTWPEHLAEEGVTEEEHRSRNRATAEQNVKTGIVLAEIAEQEKVTVTKEELDQQLSLLKAQYSDEHMQAELDKPENRRDIVSRIITDKTIQKLEEYASKK